MRIKLFGKYELMPNWWSNFSEVHLGQVDTVEEINLALLPFNCSFSVNKTKKGFGCRYIHFNTRAEYLMFVLKWS